MGNRTPKIPGRDHPITVEPAGQRVIVRVGDRVVADTIAALTLREAGYPPVRYIPINDVDQTLLRSSRTSTYCGYKGDASYYIIRWTRPRARGRDLDLRAPPTRPWRGSRATWPSTPIGSRSPNREKTQTPLRPKVHSVVRGRHDRLSASATEAR